MCEIGKHIDVESLVHDYPHLICLRSDYNVLATAFGRLYREAVWSLCVESYRVTLQHMLDELNDLYVMVKVD